MRYDELINTVSAIINDDEIETIFDVYFPGKDYTCFGTNKLMRKIK